MSKGEIKTPSQRQLRVGEELRHALAHVLERGEVHDPGLADVSVTVTEVRVSPDLRNATAFIMPLGGGAHAGAVEALTRAKGFLRRRIAEMVRLKTVPAFSFRLDESFDEAGHIEALLQRPEVARDLRDVDQDEAGDLVEANEAGQTGGGSDGRG